MKKYKFVLDTTLVHRDGNNIKILCTQDKMYTQERNYNYMKLRNLTKCIVNKCGN